MAPLERRESLFSWDAADGETVVTAMAGGMKIDTPISQMMGLLVMGWSWWALLGEMGAWRWETSRSPSSTLEDEFALLRLRQVAVG